MEIELVSKRKTRQQLNWKNCVSPLSDRVARVITIAIGILLLGQSINIAQFVWLSIHFMQFYSKEFLEMATFSAFWRHI